MKEINQIAAKYLTEPYLYPLTQEQLGIRYNAVAANAFSVGGKNKIDLRLDSPWKRYHVEIQTECGRRDIELTDIWKAAKSFEKHIPTQPDPELFKFWKSHYEKFNGRGYLFRLLEAEHADELLEYDKVYFRNADNYLEMHLTAAQKDDERCLTVWDQAAQSWKKIRTPTAFYISSYSRILEPRFLTAFKKEKSLSCVVLKRPDEFFRRLKRAVQENHLNLSVRSSRIHYIDPLRTRRLRPKEVYFSKDFLHTYQQEFRYALISDEPEENKSIKLDCHVGDLFERLDFPDIQNA